LAITALGDLIFARESGEVMLVDSKTGLLSSLAASEAELRKKLADREFVEELFHPALLKQFQSAGLQLADNEVFSITKPLSSGGTLEASNFLTMDMDVHFVILGQIYRQLADAPEGAEIGEVTIED
jgi:hypothetical protein